MNPCALLAAVVLVATSGQASPRYRSDLSIAITLVGDTPVKTAAPPIGGRREKAYYYVDSRESVAIHLSGSLPENGRLYPLVRPWGAKTWTVQERALKTSTRGEWKAEVQFGKPSEVGVRFELLVIATTGPLPPRPLPERTRVARTVVEAEIVRVERLRYRPSVGVSWIDGHAISDDREIEVRNQAEVSVTLRDLPAEARVGMVVHPLGSSRRWVMPETAKEGFDQITAYFGTGRRGEDFFRYTVSAFVAWQDDIPPPDVEIPPQEWRAYQSKFLTESRLVRVIRWEGELRIKSIGSLVVQPNLTLVVGPQEDVHGAMDRRFAPGERVWLVCIPRIGHPWLAGWTAELLPSGKWVVNPASFWQPGKPKIFDAVAVLGNGDATQVRPEALRAWVHDHRHSQHSVRLRVQP